MQIMANAANPHVIPEISKCRLELPHKQSHALNTTGGSCTETGTSANYILLEVVPKKKLT